MATTKYKYEEFVAADQLTEARNALRGAEANLFRTAELSPTPNDDVVAQALTEAERLKKLVGSLDAADAQAQS